MQISSKSRKSINFDLNDSLLKKHYLSKNYKNGWRDIKKFFEKSNFVHRQYSGYVSINEISIAEVGNIVGKMARKWYWLSKSVMQFDVTNVGEEYSFLEKIENETRLGKNEF